MKQSTTIMPQLTDFERNICRQLGQVEGMVNAWSEAIGNNTLSQKQLEKISALLTKFLSQK
jgi:hypothetical protein